MSASKATLAQHDGKNWRCRLAVALSLALLVFSGAGQMVSAQGAPDPGASGVEVVDGSEPVDLDAVASDTAAGVGALGELTETFAGGEGADAATVAALAGEIAGVRAAFVATIARLEARISYLRREAERTAGAADDAGAAAGAGAGRAAIDGRVGLIETALSDVRRELAAADAVAAGVAARLRLAEFRSGVDARRSEIETIRRALGDEAATPDYVSMRERLRMLKAASVDALRPIRDTSAALAADLERLGPSPAEGEATEAPEIAAERAALSGALVREDAIIRQSDLNVAEIDRMLEQIDDRRRRQFYDDVLRRSPSPLSTSMLAGATETFLAGFDRMMADARIWREVKAEAGALWRTYGLAALALLAGLVLFGPARRWANNQVLRRLEAREPTGGSRAAAAIVRILARAIPGFVAGAIFYQTLRANGVISPEVAPIARSIWFGFLALLAVDAGVVAAFAPGTPGWRLVPLSTVSVRIVRAAFFALTFLFFADRALVVGAEVFGGDERLALVQSAVVAILMGLIFLFISQKSVWRIAEGRGESIPADIQNVWRNLRFILRALALVMIAAAAIGYVSLAHYLAARTYMLDGLIAAALFVRLVSHQGLAALGRSLNPATPAGNEEEPRESFALFWIGAAFDLFLALALAPIVFLILGAEWEDVRGWVREAFFGFKIGGVTFSISQIFIAIAMFLAILTVTRFIQHTSEKSLLPKTRLDVGLQNSLKTLIGYVGLIIAFGAAVSALGFNLSNLAIIAGALSVGIGFGLQSIVNNFVSGLILLFERPIKVGDWIVTTSGEGIVKRISVRSTEIETFDKSSVIIPNSELIANAVTNWTHKDKLGRVIIAVGVSYDADPDQVVRLLEEVARESHLMMSYPAPYVYFVGFGDSSLDFELRGIIRDVTTSLSTRTALRIAVFKKLKGAGVEIPFPQRDLNIRSGLHPRPEISSQAAPADGAAATPKDAADSVSDSVSDSGGEEMTY